MRPKATNIVNVLESIKVGHCRTVFVRFMVWRVSVDKYIVGIDSINVHQTGETLTNAAQFILDNWQATVDG